MRYLIFAVAMASSACSNLQPKMSTTEHLTFPGHEIKVEGSWSSTCSGHSGSWKSGTDYVSDCKWKPIQAKLECSNCTVVGPAVQDAEKGYSFRVVPMGVGDMVVRITMTRSDNGEQHVEDRTVEVRRPDGVFFHCGSDRGFVGCERPLDERRDHIVFLRASEPVILPAAGIRDVTQPGHGYSHLIRVNGKVLPPEAESVGISLTTLFPDASEGDGIRPGVYPVELSLGGRVERYLITAR